MSRRGRRHAAPQLTRWAWLQRRVRLLVPAPVRRLDLAVFQAVARQHSPVLDAALPRLSRAANHSRLWFALAAVMAASGRRGRRAALRGVASIAVTSTVTNLPAKLLTGRTRPDIRVVPEARRLARVPTSTSFPSGHSASAFAFATAASAELPGVRWPLRGLASAVGASRVHTGVHYPGDVLVGAAIGAWVARATLRLWPADDPTPAEAGHAEHLDELLPDGEGIVVAANVAAGDRRGQETLRQFQQALPRLRITQMIPGEGLAATLRRVADNTRVLGVAGGDGTNSAGAQVAYERGVPLLIAATGTFNHLARDLGLERIEATVRAVRERRAVRLDLGAVDGRVFVNNVGLGLHPQFVARREALARWIGRWPGAVLAAAATMAVGAPVRVEIDGRERRLWVLSVTNGRVGAVGFAPAQRHRLDEGTLDVRLLDAERRMARLRFLAATLFGRGDRCPAYERWTAGRVRLRVLDAGARLSRDGEIEAAPWDAADLAVLPRALAVLQPTPSPGR